MTAAGLYMCTAPAAEAARELPVKLRREALREKGGDGYSCDISGREEFYAGGGGGYRPNSPTVGGAGGGGAGGESGVDGLGGGGGGNAKGGSGVVIIRYRRPKRGFAVIVK